MKQDETNWGILIKFSAVLTIFFAIILAITLISLSSTPVDDPSWNTAFHLMWVGVVGTPLFGLLWGVFYEKSKANEGIIIEKDRIKKEEQRKIEEENTKQQYEEIFDIWQYGEKKMLAVSQPQSGEIGLIHYVKLSYTNIDSTNPWVITIETPGVFSTDFKSSTDFKAKRKGNTLVGLKDDDIAIMKEGQLTINDEILYFSTENETVKNVSGLMKELLNGEKIETVRYQHLKAASEDVIDALPKFSFYFSEDGIKCDEINYPQKHLEDFFEKNKRGEYIFQNKVFYVEYCEKNGLYNFDAFQERQFLQYMHEMAIKSEYQCKTDFELSEWQNAIGRFGVLELFEIFKSYVDKKTLDVVPYAFAFEENCIYFRHKSYSPIKNETMLFYNIAIASMMGERIDKIKEDKGPLYSISKTEGGITLINIDSEVFVCIKKENVI